MQTVSRGRRRKCEGQHAPETTAFFSSGHRVDSDLHLPEDGREPYPVVVACSGFMGLKNIHPARFARSLTQLGYAVVAFDYRSRGHSEGEYGRLIPQEWVEDLRSAVDRLQTVSEVDPGRIGLLGWGLGGGVAVSAGATDSRAVAWPASTASATAVARSAACTTTIPGRNC